MCGQIVGMDSSQPLKIMPVDRKGFVVVDEDAHAARQCSAFWGLKDSDEVYSLDQFNCPELNKKNMFFLFGLIQTMMKSERKDKDSLIRTMPNTSYP